MTNRSAAPSSAAPAPQETPNMCDGCQQGLPVVRGMHWRDGMPWIGCTADHYAVPALQDLSQRLARAEQALYDAREEHSREYLQWAQRYDAAVQSLQQQLSRAEREREEARSRCNALEKDNEEWRAEGLRLAAERDQEQDQRVKLGVSLSHALAREKALTSRKVYHDISPEGDAEWWAIEGEGHSRLFPTADEAFDAYFKTLKL